MPSQNQYVVRNGNGWGVRGEGNSRLTCRTQTQAEAIQRGRELAMAIALNSASKLRMGSSAKPGRTAKTPTRLVAR